MPKKTAQRRNRRTTNAHRNAPAGRKTGPRARAFDSVVRDFPTKPVSSGSPQRSREPAEEGAIMPIAAIIRQLDTARRLAEETRNQIDKKISELRRQLRRSVA